jgi:hypothetical protein
MSTISRLSGGAVQRMSLTAGEIRETYSENVGAEVQVESGTFDVSKIK